MHPYRTSCPPDPETEVAITDDGRKIAFGVLAFVGAVQVAIALPHPGPPSAQTLFGAVCFIAGLVWLIHRDPTAPVAVHRTADQPFGRRFVAAGSVCNAAYVAANDPLALVRTRT